MGWKINWETLSNDNLLDLWQYGKLGENVSKEIEKILQERKVIEERK